MGHNGQAAPDGGELTPRQGSIVQFIDDSVRRNGYGPSLREMADASGLASASSVSYQLARLEERTMMIRPRPEPDGEHHVGRDAVSPDGDDLAQVPLVGRLAAGAPIMADQLPVDVIALPRLLVGHGELIMLTVVGRLDNRRCDRGRRLGRRPPRAAADNGDIVAAMLVRDVGAEATVKTFVNGTATCG
jgi:repressor LexA